MFQIFICDSLSGDQVRLLLLEEVLFVTASKLQFFLGGTSNVTTEYY